MNIINAIQNSNFNPSKLKEQSFITSLELKDIVAFHQTLNNKETPLVRLPGLAKRLGIGKLLIKDESHRLELNAFKVLGASYAMHKQIKKFPQIKTFCSATDGNHGRSVSWMARQLGRKAIIYMPKGAIQDRVSAIESEGAEVFVINQDYNAAVKMANAQVSNGNKISGNHSWSLIQDTAWYGYEEVPLDIMRGYCTQVFEMTRQIGMEKVDVLFLQSGVGSWAASIVGYIMNQWNNLPLCISVEPHSANCLFESIKAGNSVSVDTDKTTIMAGLNCGSVSTLAWPILHNGLIGSISIADRLSEKAMEMLANPIAGDPVVISGASGASGLGGLIGLCQTNQYSTFKERILLNKQSTVLIINTEGDTNPSNHQNVMGSN